MVLVLVPALVWTTFPAIARAQAIAPSFPGDPRAGGAGGVSMPIPQPADGELAAPERSATTASRSAAVPLEEPIDPDKYVCGSGDVFEL
ncbi:MAG: hypothetical protein ACJ79W_15550, partial [Myxococcales bacterium]